MMRLDLVSYTPAEVWRRPEGWRMKAKSAGWWRDKVAALCWRILHRLKAVEAFQYTETIYRYGEVEQGVVTDLVKKGICTVLDQGRDPNDYCIVVGAKDFSEIMRDMPFSKACASRPRPSIADRTAIAPSIMGSRFMSFRA